MRTRSQAKKQTSDDGLYEVEQKRAVAEDMTVRHLSDKEAEEEIARVAFESLDGATRKVLRDAVEERRSTAGETQILKEGEIPFMQSEGGLSWKSASDLAEDFAGAPTMGAFDRIVDGFYSIDVEREFADLEDKLMLGRAAEAEHAVLANELDLASERAWRAHRLYVNACAAHEGYELDAALVESDMRAQAIAVLRSEREAKIRTKDVTEKDVDSQMMRMFPDQVRASRVGREKAKRAVEHLKKFAELWAARQQALDAIVRTSRR